jgi:hypothetical protein
MEAQDFAVLSLKQTEDDDYILEFDELEQRLEQQLAILPPMDTDGDPCLWYGCSPHCTDKCMEVTE